MGLGKTLTTLAAIAASIQQASEFAIHAPRSSEAMTASKATLVVVPSERMYNSV
jgi:SNF2 family DNA or RNA helicase